MMVIFCFFLLLIVLRLAYSEHSHLVTVHVIVFFFLSLLALGS